MILIGNDVVDLDHSDCRQALQRTRFLKRVFSDEELAIIEAFHEPIVMLWKIWACKESAYKALAGRFPSIHFSWKSYAVSNDLKRVQFGEHELSAHVEYEPDGHVYAIAAAIEVNGRAMALQQRDLNIIREHYSAIRIIHQKNEPSEEKDSIKARELALELGKGAFNDIIGSDKTANPEELSFSNAGPRGSGEGPALIRKNGKWRIPVSISHHGRYIAAALGILPGDKFN